MMSAIHPKLVSERPKTNFGYPEDFMCLWKDPHMHLLATFTIVYLMPTIPKLTLIKWEILG